MKEQAQPEFELDGLVEELPVGVCIIDRRLRICAPMPV